MNEIPDYIANGVAVLVRPYTRELLTAEQVRAAFACARSRAKTVDELAREWGCNHRAAYMRLKRHGVLLVGRNAHGATIYNPAAVQAALGVAGGAVSPAAAETENATAGAQK